MANEGVKSNGRHSIGDAIDGTLKTTRIEVSKALFGHPVFTGLEIIDGPLGPLEEGRAFAIEGGSFEVHSTINTIAANLASSGVPVLYCVHVDRYADALAAIIGGESRIAADRIKRNDLSFAERRAVDTARDAMDSWDMCVITWSQDSNAGLSDLCHKISEACLEESVRNARSRVIIIDSIDADTHFIGYSSAQLAITPIVRLASLWTAPLLFGLYTSEPKSWGSDPFGCGQGSAPYVRVVLSRSDGQPGMLNVEVRDGHGSVGMRDALVLYDDLERVMDSFEVDEVLEKADRWEPEEILLRHKIMMSARPFEEPERVPSIYDRMYQWDTLRYWGIDGYPEELKPTLDKEGFVPFVAYELGFAKEADAFFRSAGHCKAVHDRWMKQLRENHEAEAALLTALLQAFIFMDEFIGDGKGRGSAYRICD